MISPPRRAITRFLIPLLDVLILLFCIFLLMPFVSDTKATDAADAPTGPTPDELRAKLVELELQVKQANDEAERLARLQSNPADRLSVRVLEIDPDNGRLFAFDPESSDPRQEVLSPADAQRLIDQQRRLARGKDAFFLILYPRRRSGFPEQPQVETYERWFAGVPHGFDNPWLAGKP